MGRKKGKNTVQEESNPDKSEQTPQKQQQQEGSTQPKEQKQQSGPSQPKEQKQQKQQGGSSQSKEQQQGGPSQQKQKKQQGELSQPKQQQQDGSTQPKEQKQQKQQGGSSQSKEQQQGGPSQQKQKKQQGGQTQYHQGQQPQGPWNQPGQQPQGPWNQPGQQAQGPWNQPGQQPHQGQQPQGPWNQPRQQQYQGQQPQGPWNQPAQQHHQGQQAQGPWNQPGQQPHQGQQPQRSWNQPAQQHHQGQQAQGPWNQPGQQPHQGQQPQAPRNQPGQQPQGPWNQPREQQQGSQEPLSQPGQPQSSTRAPAEKKVKPGGGDSSVGRTPSVASTKSSSSGDGVLPSLPEDLSKMQVSKQKVHRTNLRPVLCRSGAHGKRGKPVTLEVNFFRMLIDNLKGIAYHYDVTIEPDRPKKFYRPVFAQFCQETYPNVRFAFDGQKNAYTAHKVDDGRAMVTFHPSDKGKEMQFKVTVKLAANVDLGSLKNYMQNVGSMDKPMAAIQCLDVVLRCAYEGNDRFVRFKRSVYEVPRNRIDLGKGHELWYGLFQSAILGSKPYVNVDVSHKAFPSSGSMVDIFASFNRGNLETNRPLDGWLVKELHDYVRGMDVVYRSPNGTEKRMRCNGLRDAANAQQFTLDDGTKLTVADYFSRKLKFQLRYPALPVLHVGSTVRSVFVPPELCKVPPGQALNKAHPDECTAKIIKFAATSVQERKEKIMRLSTSVAYNNSPTLIDFGVGVGKEFEKLSARIIDPPTVVYAGNDQVRPSRGVWRAEGKKFVDPSSTLAKKTLAWRILNLDGYTNETMVQEFGEQIYNHALRCDVKLEPFSMQRTFVLVRNVRDAVRDLSQLLSNIKKDQPAITIVIIPSRGDVYAKVKQKAELASERIGLLTQCIKDQTVKYKRADGSTINNILLKINAKTNGSNHRLTPDTQPPLAKGRVMYIGADVTHPTGDDTPSVVGVTSVYDLHGFRYNCSVRLQGPRDEMIRDLENIVHRHVQLYQKYNGNLPERIMYYRDGVSDGQFAEILTIEMQAIHAALARFGANFKPAVTFIVVQKRHHTRFFPVGNCPTEGRNGNVMPGTVVDRDITAPNRFEFYLVSHAAVQGVAKPTKYVVLYDDSKCDPDQLQAMTLNLCYMFARCNRAVSYPAPTYYAHHAAFRGRVYLKNRRINMNDLEAAYREIQISADVHDKNPMFFV